MRKTVWDAAALCGLLSAFLAGLLYVSPHILPLSGNWQLIDAIKITHGAVLYRDVYTVSPPVIYVVATIIYKVFGTALWWYRIAGSILLVAVLCAFYFLTRRVINGPWALLAAALSVLIYVRTPWEIYFTYLYMAYGFVILSYLVLKEENDDVRYALFGLFMGLAWMAKITIGGMGSVAAIGVFGVLCAYDLAFERGRAFRTLKSALYTLVGIIAGYLLPFVILYGLGVKSSLAGSFSLIYAGGTKGSLAQLLPRPFVNLWKYAVVARDNSDVSSLQAIFKTVYQQVTLETFCGFVFVVASLALLASIIAFFLRRDSRALHSRTILVAVTSGAIAYASAMSNVFDTDSIFIVVIYLLFASKMFVDAFSSRWPVIGGYERAFYVLLITCSVLVFVLVGFGQNALVGSLALIFWAAFVVLAYYVFSRSPAAISALAAIVLMFVAFWCKYADVSYNWWESNLVASKATAMTPLGFYATPMYYQYVMYAYEIRSCFAGDPHDLSAYSFPTSTLPYHILGVLPAGRSSVHHADVFAAKYVDEEFQRIKRAHPALLFFSRWTPEKMREIDGDFSGGRGSSQTQMWAHLLPFAQAHYRLARTFVPNEALGDEYNFPQEVWVRKDLPANVRACIARAPRSAPSPGVATYGNAAALTPQFSFEPARDAAKSVNQPRVQGDSSADLQFIVPADSSNGFRFFNDGSRLQTLSAMLDRSGTLMIGRRATKPGGGLWSATSDARVKRDVVPFTDGLATADALRPVTFAYNGKGGTIEDGSRYIGLLAQQARQAMPYTVTERNGVLRYDPSDLRYVLVNAIKRLQARNAVLRARLRALGG